MQKGTVQRLLPHIIAVVIFLLAAVIFCAPALSGLEINQSDVTQWRGMAQSLLEYKEQHGRFPLWTNSTFSGMPAYQIAIESNNPVQIGYLHNLFTLFLPKPIAFFFLSCLCFYFLTQVYRVSPWIGILGALAYGFATYNPVIVATGHDTKMLSLAYIPALLASLVLVYERKYWLGGALTAVFTALHIGMNHLQMSYYFLMVAAFMTIGYIIRWVREKDFRHMGIAIAIALVAGTLGVLSNATNIFVTYDYSKATMRNGTLGLDESGQAKKAGLPIDYAFNWSYGKSETFTLLVPGIYGGSGSGELNENSQLAQNLIEKGVPEDQAILFAESQPTYWGPQPFTSGPVYLGAIICFLFLLGMIYLRTWQKWWILAAVLLAILMAWGKYFEGFNTFLFNNLPFYNKFRAPTQSLVIPQLLFPLVAVMALQRFFFDDDSREDKWKGLKHTVLASAGILAICFYLYISFDYEAAYDNQVKQSYVQAMQGQEGPANEMYGDLKEGRKALFGGDLLRSFLLIALAAALLAGYVRNKLGYAWAIGLLIALNVYDLFGVGKRYLNKDNFVEAEQYDAAFTPTPADVQIKQDTGYYRVLNLSRDVFQDATTSYHHNSIGGYHPAKLSITEDLLNFQLRNKQPMNFAVLNMLNTKYVIVQDPQSGQVIAQQNPDALGPAWFVKALRFEKDGMPLMRALDYFTPADTAIIAESDRQKVTPVSGDSTGTIRLIANDNDEILYTTNAAAAGFAVFSEIYYDRGWKAYIDDREVPIIRTNYVLRGLNVPAGQHTIRFEFRPASFYTGETIALIVNILILLLLVAALFMEYKKRNRRTVAA